MNLEQFLPTKQERGKHTGLLSTFAEYHALGIGFLGAAARQEELVGAYALGTGGGKARRSGHMIDAAKEPAYVALGLGVYYALRLIGLIG